MNTGQVERIIKITAEASERDLHYKGAKARLNQQTLVTLSKLLG